MMMVEITGPRGAVEKILEQQSVADARRRDRHGLVWIEAADLPLEVEHHLQGEGLKVHHVEGRG
jgi:hypothetical protein